LVRSFFHFSFKFISRVQKHKTPPKMQSIFRGAENSHGSTLIMIFFKIITQEPLTQGKAAMLTKIFSTQLQSGIHRHDAKV